MYDTTNKESKHELIETNIPQGKWLKINGQFDI